MSQPKASRHLAVLREAKLVITRRNGKWMHYRINPDMPLWCYRILEAMRDGSYQETIGLMQTDSGNCGAQN